MHKTQPIQVFSMLEGFKPYKNLLGVGDPNVHKINNQWWMFFGGAQRNFKNNLFSACLSVGEPLNSKMKWKITSDPNNPRRALPFIDQPDKNQWDGYGLHEPCFAEGFQKGDRGNFIPCQRIYYTGRKSKSVLANDEPFSIGFLEKTSDGWKRNPEPIIKGDDRNTNVLAPKVIYGNGKWRMWYRATPKEAPKGEKPLVEIYYTESEDGVSNWKKPTLFFARKDEIAHAYPLRTENYYEMLASKIPNLYGESFYPEQELWLLKANEISGERGNWSKPTELINARNGEEWFRGGFFGSSFCEADLIDEKGSRYVFFTGIHEPINKVKLSVKRLLSFRKPPILAPFYFSIGYFRYTYERDET